LQFETKTARRRVVSILNLILSSLKARCQSPHIDAWVSGSTMGGAAAYSAATPDRAVRMAGVGQHRPILRDFEDDRISHCISNTTRSLSLMSALRVNSGTAKQKDRPKAVSLQR
jgi:hypothetical protein